MQKIEMVNHRFGNLVVLSQAANVGQHLAYNCRCDCGTEKVIVGQSLRSGRTVSCGCYGATKLQRQGRRLELRRADHPEYVVWEKIKRRTGSPDERSYANYGGRGIKLHEPWRNDFWAFANWLDENLGPRPDGMTLDRIDNDGHYEPGNLKWSTKSEQSLNRRQLATLAELNLWRERAIALGWVD